MKSDRYINRRLTEMESALGCHQLSNQCPFDEPNEVSKRQYVNQLSQVMFGVSIKELNSRSIFSKISTKNKEDEFIQNFAQRDVPPLTTCQVASIEKTRILDAPEVRNDFSLHTLSWGKNHSIYIALSNELYSTNDSVIAGNLRLTISAPDYFSAVSAGK